MYAPKIENKSWRKFLSDLTQIKTSDSTVERKGQLLNMFFAIIAVLILYILVENIGYWLLHRTHEYTIFVIQDFTLAVLFFGLWKLNQNGWVQTAANLSILIYILGAVFLAPPDYLEYLLVVLALPIGISSFLISPASSFFFATLTTLAYVISSVATGYTWTFNLLAILSLFALALMTWVISWRLESIIEQNANLVVSLQKSNAQIRDAYETTLEGWSLALDLRDKETEGHTQRVTELTLRLAKVVGVDEESLVQIRRGALLHDIGKLGVPDTILLKPGELTEEEFNLMKQHPRYAYGLLYPIQYLRDALDIPCHHHEKWDGSGYPQGIAGEQIPLAARIFAVVDVYDALTNDRPYRKGWEKQKVLEYIQEQSGRHFDPRIVEIFLKEINKDADKNFTRA